MKHGIFLTIILFLGLNAFGQKDRNKVNVPYDSITQKYTYTRIVELPNKDIASIYTSAKKWCIKKYSDEKFLIDTENDQLTDLGNFTINVTMKSGVTKVPFVYTIIYNLTFLFKEGKCKFEITNIKLSQNAQGSTQEQTMEAFEKQTEGMGMGKNIMKGFVVDVFNEIDLNMLKLIAEIELALKDENKSKSDW